LGRTVLHCFAGVRWPISSFPHLLMMEETMSVFLSISSIWQRSSSSAALAFLRFLSIKLMDQYMMTLIVIEIKDFMISHFMAAALLL
jgi:hypothetical protein